MLPAEPALQPEVVIKAEKPRTAAAKNESVAAPPIDNPTEGLADRLTDNSNLAAAATHVTNPTQETQAPMSLAERSLAIASRRHTEISSTAITASQQRPDLRDRPATTSKPKLTDHAAANVLMEPGGRAVLLKKSVTTVISQTRRRSARRYFQRRNRCLVVKIKMLLCLSGLCVKLTGSLITTLTPLSAKSDPRGSLPSVLSFE
ncbi:MAG: hypothetical protein U5L02_01230 [Rheinheimera sp.]|nr:hypothetical protein [Rheinheimera sp.]